MAEWIWNEAAQRYMDATTKRFISRAYVMSLAHQSIKSSFDVTNTLVSYVANGQLSVPDFTTMFWGEIRGEYIRQYMSGMGGSQVMTPADWGTIGGSLGEQKKYFDNFMKELPNLTEGQINQRAAMYINSAHEVHDKARMKAAKKWGADEVAWNLGDTEHCDLCLQWNAMGYQPIGTRGGFPTTNGEAFPCDGNSCEGLTKCGCYLTFRNSKTGEEYEG